MDIYRKQPIRQALTVVLDCVRVSARDRTLRDVDKVIVGYLPGIKKITTG